MIATNTVKVNISLLICPKEIPCITIIKENSLIWAREIAVKNPVRFLYPKNEHINIVIIGLNIKINNIIKINRPIIDLKDVVIRPIPKETKNIVAKKSRRDLTFPIISKLYGRFAKVTPAIKAPMTMEKPI